MHAVHARKETTMPQLARNPIHLGFGTSATSEPVFDGTMQWYEAYSARHAAEAGEKRLVSQSTFDAPWRMWEMHPQGSEVVLCTASEITLVQEIAGEPVRTTLRAGEYAINGPGVWHTADV